MKKLIRLLFLLHAAVSLLIPAGSISASSISVPGEMADDYQMIMEQAGEYGIPFSMTYEEYIRAFIDSGFETADEYADAYLGLMEPMEHPYGGKDPKSESSKAWFYNTGSSLPEDAVPVYEKYDLFRTVQKGDIIFEANGGFGLTGHIAIVEGKYYNAARKVQYIRLIEVISEGVVRSCLDDTRVDARAAEILRVSGAVPSAVNAAVDFCAARLGAAYALDFQKDTDPSEPDWYCSELVWAAYYHQGIDLEPDGITEPGITPHDIRNSPLTYPVYFK